ncbi:MAG: SH3 domain-containing protein, partial [Burkholderiales bacterium]|nr:SH3 domain-containing protein [Burkholderiales bacterium]
NLIIFSLLICGKVFADDLPVYDFPMNNYPQNISAWLANESDTSSLLSNRVQQQRFTDYKSRYFGTGKNDPSPWAANFIGRVLSGTAKNNIYLRQKNKLVQFDNTQIKESTKTGYGLNFLAYSDDFINKIRDNMQLEQFSKLQYNANNRAIATDNITAYIIPTTDPWYYNYTIAGQGFPFNNNMLSSVYLGTSLYVIGKSHNQQWLLVQTPHFMGWVPAKGVAYVTTNFIARWHKLTNKSLIDIILPDTSLINQHGGLITNAMSGTILPTENKLESGFYVFVPWRNVDNIAKIATAFVSNVNAVVMPMKLNRQNMIKVISGLLGRTYGWGGYLGYNDCSADMQAIFSPFGFYMPRNSAQQITVGEITDLTNKTTFERMSYLLEQGIPFTTLVYIPGHIMLYVGNAKFYNQIVPVVYENVWGMRKNGENSRYIIGKSVLFPLMLNYPESSNYMSYFNKLSYKLSNINTLVNK